MDQSTLTQILNMKNMKNIPKNLKNIILKSFPICLLSWLTRASLGVCSLLYICIWLLFYINIVLSIILEKKLKKIKKGERRIFEHKPKPKTKPKNLED